MANANIELPIRWPLSAFTISTTRVIGTESLNFWYLFGFFCVYKLPVNDIMMMCVCSTLKRTSDQAVCLLRSHECERSRNKWRSWKRQKKCIMIEIERETKRRRRKAETSSSGRILQWLVRNGEGHWNDSHNQSSIAVVDLTLMLYELILQRLFASRAFQTWHRHFPHFDLGFLGVQCVN